LAYSYRIFVPDGNTTALVMGIEPDAAERRRIQDEIMRRYGDVEQVGFISGDSGCPRLEMAGGEFCGNAVRAAAWHYLGGRPGEILIRSSGTGRALRAGVLEDLRVWTQMPVYESAEKVRVIEDGLYWAEMEGISHLVVSPRRAVPEPARMLESAKNLLLRYDLYGGAACGVIFTERVSGALKIHPCVFVIPAGTAYYETACGSGSVAVALAAAALRGSSKKLPLLQPSGKIIEATVEYADKKILEARICGRVR